MTSRGSGCAHGAGTAAWLRGLGLTLSAVLALAACGPQPPIRIGFAGGVEATGFGVSEDGRNGALLAIDAINRQGGVNGRLLELVVRELPQEREAARAGAQELLAANIQAVVGPFTSTQALAMLEQADAAGMVLLSPIVSAPELIGRDDQLLRLNRALADSARAYAETLAARGQRRLAVAFDESNQAYTGPWLDAFRTRLGALGGQVVAQAGFHSGPDVSYAEIVRRLLVASPDGVLVISRGADAARLAQQLRKQGAALPIAAAEWAATQSLIQLGGSAVEGLITAQAFDPDEPSARYQAFGRAYRERYAREPGLGAIASHDAVTVLADAMARSRAGQPLKDALLAHGPYQGLQGTIAFDRFGDTQRRLHFVVVRDGSFARLH